METAAALGADTVECRLDFLCPPPQAAQLEQLLTCPPLEVIVTCRPKRQGGRFEGNEADRLEMLAQAAKFKPAFIDVEMDVPRRCWPDAPIILSHHDFQGIPKDLDQLIQKLDASDAAVNKIAFMAAGPEDAIAALQLLRRCSKPTLALAMGEAGLLSRVLAKKFGAFGTFASLEPQASSAPGQPTLEQFLSLYRWNSLGPATMLYGLVGCPVEHSMGPAVHNAAFQASAIDAVYLPLRVEPGVENFQRFFEAALANPWLGLRGLSVTIPHKQNALATIGHDPCEELARKIGAINTIALQPDGTVRGFNSDYGGAMDALCNAMDIPREGLSGKTAAVLGAGGAARAIVAGFVHYGAEVTIYNRTLERGQKLAEEFNCRAVGLEAVHDLTAEILVNCTSLGMHPNVASSPLEKIPPSVRVVFDTVYNPMETRLLRLAKAMGCRRVSGLDMFVNQAVSQFEIWTGSHASKRAMRKVVVEKLQQAMR